MKWRMIDSIEDFKAWTSASGRKTVSLEEYHLLEVLGRKGAFPESLVLESCVHLARWLVAASSEFTQSCTLLEVEQFAFENETRPGAVLTVTETVLSRHQDTLRINCEVMMGTRKCGQGEITLALVPLKDLAVAEDTGTLWRELYAKA